MGGESLSAEKVIGIADSAMYRVKNNGKNGHLILEYPCNETEIVTLK